MGLTTNMYGPVFEAAINNLYEGKLTLDEILERFPSESDREKLQILLLLENRKHLKELLESTKDVDNFMNPWSG